MANQIIQYIPNQRQKTWIFATWWVMAKNMWQSRELIYQLFRRDFIMQYRKSFLGITWVFISPIIGIVSWVFLNAAGILTPGDVGIPFSAYVLLSSTIWGLFMGFFNSASNTLGTGSGFIMQVKFPHEALLIKQTAQYLANFTLTFVLNIVVLLLFGVVPTAYILLMPLLALPLFFLGAGLGLITSVISVVATDVSRVISTGLGLVMYITPVIYAPTTDNQTLQTILDANPLTYLVGGFRDLIVYGETSYPERYLAFAVVSFVIFLIALRLFYVSEQRVIEKMF